MRNLLTTTVFLLAASAHAGQLAVAPISGNEESRFLHLHFDANGEDLVFASMLDASYVAEFEGATLQSLSFDHGLAAWTGAEVLDNGTLQLSELTLDSFTVQATIDGITTFTPISFPDVWSEPIVATSVEQLAPLEWRLAVDGPWQNVDVEVADGIRLTRFGFFPQDVTVGVPEPASGAIGLLCISTCLLLRKRVQSCPNTF